MCAIWETTRGAIFCVYYTPPGRVCQGRHYQNLDKIRHGLYTIPWKAAFAPRFLFKLHTAGGWSPFHYSTGISFWLPEMNHERGCYMMEFYFLMALLMLIVLERILNGRNDRN